MTRGSFLRRLGYCLPLLGLTAKYSSAFGSDFAICAHPSHGTTGWTGPVRTGPNSKELAWADARAHNKANKGHDASV
jgi:hypothetical protein